MSPELLEYFTTLIGPPGKELLYVPDIKDDALWSDLASKPDASFGGAVAVGTPTEAQAKELMRVLLPGAHLLLVAPDVEPTGHTGAIRIEDAGFEIRDAILLADEAKGLHYVPKANRKERDAGCAHLEGKSGFEAVEREEGSAGTDSPRAGAGRTAHHVKNFHPTVKPVELMSKLFHDVPKDQGAVLDPFLGSGTTAVAAALSGYSAIGIEREKEYLEIADARVRHAVQSSPEARYAGIQINSDVHVPVPPPKALSFEDAFGFEDD